jgi:copper chaperone
MKTVKYKTNINCNNCIQSVTPFLNELDNLDSWKVDIDNPDKILEVELDDDNDAGVVKAVEQAGYKIEKV